MAVTFDTLMKGFGVVTVMNACIFEMQGTYTAARNCYNIVDENGQYAETNVGLKPSAWKAAGEYIDTLKIANLTQEGPTKTVSGGQYANPLIKYGKTMTCEMQDALGRASTLKRFFGCDYEEGSGRLSITDKFPGAFAIEGDTFFIDQKTGEKKHVFIFIPQFIPDAILTLTQDAEGDATVFDLNGTVAVTDIVDADGSNPRSVFYEIRETSFFAEQREALEQEKENNQVTNYVTQTIEVSLSENNKEQLVDASLFTDLDIVDSVAVVGGIGYAQMLNGNIYVWGPVEGGVTTTIEVEATGRKMTTKVE